MSNITATYSTGTNTTATINNNTTGPKNVSVTSPSVAQLQSNVNKFVGLSDVNASTLDDGAMIQYCLLYTSPSPRDNRVSRMPSSA